MALISCPECHSQISDTAPSCPQCGFERSDQAEHAASPTKYILKHFNDVFMGIMGLGLLWGFISTDLAFVKYNVQIAQFTLYPWVVVPMLLAMFTRLNLWGALWVGYYGVIVGVFAGPEYITFYG
jgi:hypothetical protein